MRLKSPVLLIPIAVALVVVVLLWIDRDAGPDRPGEPGRHRLPATEPRVVPAAATAPEIRPGWRMMKGIVLDTDTLEPVPGARIRFDPPCEKLDVVTDEHGEWRHPLPRRAAPSVEGTVTARGYSTDWIRLTTDRDDRVLLAAPPAFLKRLTVMVFGTVLGSDGKPLVGASVLGRDAAASVRTGPGGRFGPLAAAHGKSWVSVYTATGIDWVQSLDITTGTEGPVEMTIRIPTPRHARGITVDEAGKPLPDVLLHDIFMGEGPRLRSGPDGRFRWPLLSPGVSIDAEKEGYVHLQGRQRLRAETEARIVLERAASIEGRVVAADGSLPPTGLWVAAPDDRCPVGPNGTYRLGPMAASMAELTVEYPIPCRYTYREWRREVLEVDPRLSIGEHRTGYEIRLLPLLPFEGTVIDARTRKPIAGASVEHLVTDTDGRYVLYLGEDRRGADDILLEVEADGYLRLLTFHSARDPVELRPARWIDVEAVDEADRPVPGVVVRVEDIEGVSGVTGAAGTCRIQAANDDSANITCVPHRREPITVDVAPGRASVRVVVGPRPIRYAIVVCDENDHPLPNAWLEYEGRRVPADADGRLEVVATDSRVYVTAPGREMREVNPDDQSPGDVRRYRLREAATVIVRFLYADGRPITGLEVQSVRTDTWTDAEGRVTIPGIARGTRIGLQYDVPGWDSEQGFATSGEEESVIRLPDRGEIVVRYAAEDAGNAEPRVRLFRAPDFHDAIPTFRSDRRGEVRLSAQDGTFSLGVRIAPGAWRLYPDLAIRAGRPIVLDYDFPKPARVTGIVTGPGWKPLAGARIRRWDIGRRHVDMTDKSGRFVLEANTDYPAFAVGPIRLFVGHWDYAPTLTSPIDISRDQDLTIPLTKGGTLRGGVAGGLRLAEVQILTEGAVEDPECDVDDDGTVFGCGPIRAGRHRIRIRTKDGKTFHREVEIVDGEETVVTFRPD